MSELLVICVSICVFLCFLGPCGGKTTGQARLCSFFESMNWKVSLSQRWIQSFGKEGRGVGVQREFKRGGSFVPDALVRDLLLRYINVNVSD